MTLLIFLLRIWSFQEGQLAVLPTKEEGLYRVIYQGDMKWDVKVSLLDEKGRNKMRHEIKDTDKFLLPIDLSKEGSGTYTVQISTPAYDLNQEFEFVSYEDAISQTIVLNYETERKSVKMEGSEPLKKELKVYIVNESGELLIKDEVPQSNDPFFRVYNLRGAPASSLNVRLEMSGKMIVEKQFNF